MSRARALACLVVTSAALSACAASKQREAASASEPPPPGGAVAPAEQAQASAPPPPPQAAPAQPGAFGAGPDTRGVAIAQASRDLEAARRELDVAAGDCRNACRALGSMDRAAGRLCGMSQAPDEARRCEDAKRTLLSARDRVRATCGECPGGPSVERDAPVPSLR